MKHKLSLLVGLASLAALVGATAQTAVTDPVGYITVNIAGNTPANNLGKINLIAPTLVEKTEFAGVPSADASGTTTVTFAGTLPTLAANQYYLEIGSGANEGFNSTITAATANSVTLATAVPAGSAGATVSIRKHVTLLGFLGATAPTGVQAGTELSDSDGFQFYANNAPGKSYFYANAESGGGLRDADGAIVGTEVPDPIIPPGAGLLAIRRGATDIGLVRTGYVKLTKTKIPVVTGLNVIEAGVATGVTLANSGLDTGNAATGLQRGEETNSADTISFLPAYTTGGVEFFAAEGLGIVNQDGEAPKANEIITEGRAVLLKKISAPGTVTFSAQPYNRNNP